MTNISQIFDVSNPSQEVIKILGSQYSNDSGVPVSPDNALNFSALGRAVRAIANPIATVPKHMFQSEGDKRVKLVDHAAQILIGRKPNRYTKAVDWFGNAQLTVLLWGNFYAKIIRDQNYNPVELIRFPDGIIKPVLSNGDVVYVNRKTSEVYASDEIFHIKDWSLDGIEGMSRVAQYRQGIGIGMVAEKFQASFFGKGVHQGGIVTLPADYDLGDTPEEEEREINKLRKQITDTYTGTENYHKVMLLEPGMDFKALTMPLKDAEFLMSRKFQVVEIARMFDVTQSKLFDYERSTHSNIEQQSIDFVQEGVMPWAVNWEQEINDKLTRESEKGSVYCKFNLDALIRADIKTRYEAHSISLGEKGPGWKSPSEVRSVEDLNPIGADELFKPMNFNRQSEGDTNES